MDVQAVQVLVVALLVICWAVFAARARRTSRRQQVRRTRRPAPSTAPGRRPTSRQPSEVVTPVGSTPTGAAGGTPSGDDD